jgi:arginyl-tRNA--protein-N-Asp/Glu arginylyltransferase
MSWEEMYRRYYPCKCGKSTFTEIGEMDDWNRFREYRVINCPECAKLERIEVEKQKEKQIKNEKRLRELAADIKDSFENSYMDEWFAIFQPLKSKKEAWQLAHNMGVENKSLSSFYQFSKGISIKEYAKNLVSIRNMDKIIATLHIQDNILSAKVKEAGELMQSTFVVGIH